jgi:chemotaxis signal transduction protein
LRAKGEMNENGVKLVCFELCGEKFAFNMDYLVEIVQVRYSDITPFFSPIPVIRGEWNYRARTVYIIDLREFFGLENTLVSPSDSGLVGGLQEQDPKVVQQGGDVPPEDSLKKTPAKSVLVVRIREQIFGLLTDTVLQVVPLVVFYEYPGMISTLPKRYFAGVTIIATELVIILAIEEFINDYELDTLLSRIIDN